MEEKGKEQMDRDAENIVLSIYMWLDGNRPLLRLWRRFGKEILDEAVTNLIERRIMPYSGGTVKLERFEIKRTARGLVETYIELRRGKYPVTEFFWSLVGKLLGWPLEIPPGVRLFK